MQVTHVNDHVTHAVIGGGQTIDFGISNSAEFFNILSSTLYKDQILAVVREVMCNAWDAHIEAGCTDKAVEVTLADGKITFKDFGKGIHRDDMGPIYGTYGSSTKKNDGTQTGGFGLGCKAPFAYTDHFEVTSSYAGIKTIYNLSKSSAQAQGRPGIVPITSFPTQETGLQVSIRIKTPQDIKRFTSLVRIIARNGDMNVSFNGNQADTLNFDTSKSNYLVTRDDQLLSTDHKIMIRYGNVIYPVDQTIEILDGMKRINAHLDRMGSNQINYRIVFQAPPHSIAVTPSRESLSMQEHTVATLNNLFAGFLKDLDNRFEQVCGTYAEQAVVHAVKEAHMAQLLDREAKLPGTKENFEPISMADLESMARRYLVKHYPQGIEFRKQDIKRRLSLMAEAGLLDRGIVQTYMRDLVKVDKLPQGAGWGRTARDTDWLQKRIIAPVINKLVKAGLDHKRLYVCDPEDQNTPNRYNRTNYPPITVATSARPNHLFNALPYLRNIIVVSTALTDLTTRAYQDKVFSELGQYAGFLFYHATKKVAEKDAVLAFFKQSGMHVVDLTVGIGTPAVLNKRFIAASTAPRKPAKKGLVSMASIISAEFIDTRLSRKDTAPRILSPEFVVSIPDRQDQSKFELQYWDKTGSRYIVDLIGTKGGVTNNSAVHKKWIKNGAKEFNEYLLDKMCNHMMTSPGIQEYWPFNFDRVTSYTHALDAIMRLVYSNAVMRKEFGLVNNLTVEDEKYLYLWKHCAHKWRYSMPPEVLKTATHLKSIPIDPINETLMKRLIDNPFIYLINNVGFTELLQNKKSTPAQITKAIEILITILKH